MPLPDEDAKLADVAKIGNLIHAAARTTLNTQVRVDEQRLRRKNMDIMPEILETLNRERARLEGRIVEHAAS